jgi:C4-dicarboxylate-specific signal transduction histidine kinase
MSAPLFEQRPSAVVHEGAGHTSRYAEFVEALRRVSGLPVALEAIILKLLAKNPEDRYQTTAGIEADLRRCMAVWMTYGQIDPFPLGERDMSDRRSHRSRHARAGVAGQCQRPHERKVGPDLLLENACLRAELQRSEDALRDAQAALVHAARLTTMGELAASIAHEVNQPLASIVTNAQACLRWLERDEPNLERARNAADRIVRDGHAAGDVMRCIRAMLRKSAPEVTQLHINSVITEVLELLRGELNRHDVLLEIELFEGLEPIAGDRVQLQQVIVNLVKNGIEALSAVTGRKRILRVTTQLDATGSALIAVEDSGTGLEQAQLHRLFEPFFTTKREGMGLGLSICRSIVEGQGGRLWAAPRLPHGSTFQFTVPTLKPGSAVA